MTDKLKPCPLCNGPFTYGQEPHDNYPVGAMYYFFHKGGAKGCNLHFGGHFDDLAEAIAAWNTRTPTPAPQDGAPEIDAISFERLRQNFTSNFFSKGPNMNAPEMSSMLVQIRDENIRLKKEADLSDARIAELEAEVAILVDNAFEEAKAPKWDRRAEAVIAMERDLRSVDVAATARNEALEEAAEWHESRAIMCEKEVEKDAKGKQKYSESALRHRWFAGNIRALKTPEGDG